MIVKTLINSYTRIFAVTDDRRLYLGHCGLKRVTLYNNRLLTHTRLSFWPELQKLDGADLHITAAECRDPSKYKQEEVIMKFWDCRINRSWLLNVCALIPGELATVDYHAEFTFDDYWLSGEYENLIHPTG